MSSSKLGFVAFGYGVPATIRSNQQIGQIVSNEARMMRAPVYTQLDVPIESGVESELVEEMPGEPPPTLRIARGAVQWAMRKGLTELRVVAAAPHMRRAMRDMKMAVRETRADIDVSMSAGVGSYEPGSWYCADSTQLRTTSEKEWRKRERILDIMPFWLYKLVAS